MFSRVSHLLKSTLHVPLRAMSTGVRILPMSGNHVLFDADLNLTRVTWHAVMEWAKSDEATLQQFQQFMDCDTPIILNSRITVNYEHKDRPRTTRLLKFGINTVRESINRRLGDDIYDLAGEVDLVSSSAIAVDLDKWSDQVISNVDRCRKLLVFKGNVYSDTAAEMAKIGVSPSWTKFTVAKCKKE